MTLPPHLLDFVRISCPADVVALAPHLLPDDREDLRRLGGGQTPREALTHGLRHSAPCVTFFLPGRPTAVMGMGGIIRPAIVWLLFHEDLLGSPEGRRLFLARCPAVRDWLLSLTPTGFMCNRTHATSRRVRRWLKWLGARELPPTPEGIVHFYFQKEASCAHQWRSA